MTTRAFAVLLGLMALAGCAAQREPAPAPEAADSDTVPRAELAAKQAELDALRDELETARREVGQLRLELAQARQRGDGLERETRRLRADLADAEEALVALESGLKGLHTRADAVSALADARIAVARAMREADWRRDRIEVARAKLAEAERQIEASHFGSAMFFTARARRIAEEALAEAREVRGDPDTRYVQPDRANVRARPSMEAPVAAVLERGTPVLTRGTEGGWVRIVTPGNAGGWIYGRLLAADEP